jgi:3-phosphoglycerate kinase
MKAKASLAPVAAELKNLLGDTFVGLADDCIGDAVKSQIDKLTPGQVSSLNSWVASDKQQCYCLRYNSTCQCTALQGVIMLQVLLLENTRFHKGDTKNYDSFAEALVKTTGAEVFIMDAFGAAHRNQASVTVGPCLLLQRLHCPSNWLGFATPLCLTGSMTAAGHHKVCAAVIPRTSGQEGGPVPGQEH